MRLGAGRERRQARCKLAALIESARAAHRNLFLDGCGPATGLSWQASGVLSLGGDARQKIAEYLVP